MTTEEVWSPVEDKNIRTNMMSSPIWQNCYHEEEVTDLIRMKYPKWFVYHIRFEGLKPYQLTKVLKK